MCKQGFILLPSAVSIPLPRGKVQNVLHNLPLKGNGDAKNLGQHYEGIILAQKAPQLPSLPYLSPVDKIG
jgi:hypothetical protein